MNGCPRASKALLATAAWITLSSASPAQQTPVAAAPKPPLVWIFNGTPGDEEHHAFYEANLARLRRVFTERFGVAEAGLTMLYGPQSAGYNGVCNRENLQHEIARAVSVATADQPVWLIFEGHANPTATGAAFNLPGPDVSARELGEWLAKVSPEAHLVILFTTSSSGRFLPAIAGRGRLVITATLRDEEDNETEFPPVLASVLENPASDVDHDERLSLLEIFNACNAGVKAAYDRGGYLQRERAMLDGDGDGRGTQRPARADAEPAARVFLTLPASKKRGFD